MAMEDLRAKKAFRYAGRPLRVGDTFQAPPSHAKVLRLAGNAETYIAPVVQAKPPNQRRPRKTAAESRPAAGAYERRDLTPGSTGQEEE